MDENRFSSSVFSSSFLFSALLDSVVSSVYFVPLTLFSMYRRWNWIFCDKVRNKLNEIAEWLMTVKRREKVHIALLNISTVVGGWIYDNRTILWKRKVLTTSYSGNVKEKEEETFFSSVEVCKKCETNHQSWITHTVNNIR